jgi:virulence-associated protein VagC
VRFNGLGTGGFVKTYIVRISKAQRVRIPMPLLEQTELQGEVEITAVGKTVVIRPIKRGRAGWAAAFQEMASRGDDALIDVAEPSLSAWDEREWEWR